MTDALIAVADAAADPTNGVVSPEAVPEAVAGALARQPDAGGRSEQSDPGDGTTTERRSGRPDR